jgi:hypothetical protein
MLETEESSRECELEEARRNRPLGTINAWMGGKGSKSWSPSSESEPLVIYT